MIDDGSHVRGAIQPHHLQRLVIGGHYSWDAGTVRVIRISIESELMRDLGRNERVGREIEKLGSSMEEHVQTCPPIYPPNPRAGNSLSL